MERYVLRRRLLLALGVVLLANVGCAVLREGRVHDQPTVKGIRFVEEHQRFRWLRGTSDYTLRTAIVQKSSAPGAHFLYVVERTELDLESLEDDARRMELWYAHHGFFDARFQGWEIRQVRPKRSWRTWIHRGWAPYPKVVQVVGHVREGPSSHVRSVTFEGLDAVPALRGSVTRRVSVTVGDRFDLEAHEATIQQAMSILQNASFARAKVEGVVNVWPEEQAVDLVYRVSGVGVGQACRFGEVEITGGDRVPKAQIREAVVIEPGKAFSASALSETQLGVFSLGVFSLVQVQPDLAVPGQNIPVRVDLTETRFRELRLGPGLGVENGEQFVRLGAVFAHSNLLERLFKLDITANIGLKSFASAEGVPDLSGVAEEFDSTPVADAEVALTTPGFLRPDLSLRQAAEFEIDEDPGGRFRHWDLSPSLTWKASRNLSLVVAYHYGLWSGDLDERLRELEPFADFKDDYRILSLEQRLLHDKRNDPIRTREGTYADLGITEAGLGAGYRFLHVKGDLRGFLDTRRWRKQLGPTAGVLATRLAGGWTAPHDVWAKPGDSLSRVPYPDRFQVGGSNSVRGWMPNMLGPVSCSDPGDLDTCEILGGVIALWGTVEYRMDLPWDSALAGFLDVGQAWETPEDFDLSDLQPSAGVGLRIGTPVGPMRLDFAFRLKEDVGPVEFPGFNVHFGLSEAF
jgi:outer membrane protein assembly factor BamA